MRSTTLIAFAATFCRDLAGADLMDAPLYVALQGQLSPSFAKANECQGYTAPNLDLYLKDHLGDRWFGRGPAMIINDLAIQEDYDAEDQEHAFLTAVVHELAHILLMPRPANPQAEPDPQRLQFERLVLADAVAKPAVLPKPYFGHEIDFIRVALHLHHRTKLAGVRIGANQLCAGRRYGLSRAEAYAYALDDESERMVNDRFRDILATEPPERFTHI